MDFVLAVILLLGAVVVTWLNARYSKKQGTSTPAIVALLAGGILCGFGVVAGWDAFKEWRAASEDSIIMYPVPESATAGKQFPVSGQAKLSGKNQLWILVYRPDGSGFGVSSHAQVPVAKGSSLTPWKFSQVQVGRLKVDEPGAGYQISASILDEEGAAELEQVVRDHPTDPFVSKGSPSGLVKEVRIPITVI